MQMQHIMPNIKHWNQFMEKSHLAIVGKLFSPSRTIFELAQGLLDSNTSE